MVLNIITIPTGAETDILANVGTLFTDLWVIIACAAVGIPLAFYIIHCILKLIPKETKKGVHFDFERAEKLTKEYERETAFFKKYPLAIDGKIKGRMRIISK